MQIVIKKATVKGSLFLTYTFEQIDSDVKNKITTNSDAPIHEDLQRAFRKLIPHFAFISEEIKDEDLVRKAIKKPEDYLFSREESVDDAFFKYRVFGFDIGEKDGYEKIVISGGKQLESMSEIPYSIPAIGLGDDNYVFHAELENIVEELKNEVAAYMQGKTAPKAQIEMFGDEEYDENEQEI